MSPNTTTPAITKCVVVDSTSPLLSETPGHRRLQSYPAYLSTSNPTQSSHSTHNNQQDHHNHHHRHNQQTPGDDVRPTNNTRKLRIHVHLPRITSPRKSSRKKCPHCVITDCPTSPRNQPPPPIDRCSLAVIYFLTVVAEAARGLLLPSIWPHYASLGGSKAGLGLLIGIYSLGRMLSVIPLGHISDNVSASWVLIITSLIQAVGHAMYATAPDVRMLYAARALVGLGSASTSVARAHVTKAVPQCRRTHHLAYLSGLQFIGFAVLPAFGGMFANMPSSELRFGDMMQEANARSALTVLLNGFTYPAWVLVFANVLGAVLVALFYASPGKPCRSDVLSPLTSPSSARYGQTIPLCEEELHTEGREDRVLTSPVCSGRARRTKHGTFETMPESSTTPATKPDWVALTICLLINLVFRGVLAQLETVSIPFMTEQFGMDYGTASIWMSMIGAVGVCIYFSFKPVSGTFSDKTLVFMGLTFIALGCFPLSIPAFSKELSLSSYIMLLSFTWSVAYPVGQTATLALFSKVLGGYNVGSFMGLFSASGALSPLLLSALATKLWEFYGRESVFAFILVTVFVAGVLLSLTYRRLTAARLPF